MSLGIKRKILYQEFNNTQSLADPNAVVEIAKEPGFMTHADDLQNAQSEVQMKSWKAWLAGSLKVLARRMAKTEFGNEQRRDSGPLMTASSCRICAYTNYPPKSLH